MTRNKSTMESLFKNHHENDVLGTNVSTKVLGPGIFITESRETKSMKL